MNVLLVHNHYQQAGGEDQVFDAEASLLASRGHSVSRYEVHNDDVARMTRLELAKNTVWNSTQYRRLRRLIRAIGADVVHVHNTLPLISPAVYFAAGAEGAAVVQTLHNFRMVCPSGLLFREGAPCELCLGRPIPLPSVRHACYRRDRAATGTVAAMLMAHRAAGTYRHKVHRYVALTQFARGKFIEGGLPEDRITVKPNFLQNDPGPGTGQGRYALFVGRLSVEKGVLPLMEAWKHVGSSLPLRVIGDGPLREEVEALAAGAEGVQLLGRLPHVKVLDQMRSATVLVVPSVCYEGLPLAVIEAFATGTPVIASRLGALSEIVGHERTGLHVAPGDSSGIAEAALGIAKRPERVSQMRLAARAEFERTFSADANYAKLMQIYEGAMREAIVGRQ